MPKQAKMMLFIDSDLRKKKLVFGSYVIAAYTQYFKMESKRNISKIMRINIQTTRSRAITKSTFSRESKSKSIERAQTKSSCQNNHNNKNKK